MVADHKGLLAMDESNGTCDKRLERAGIPRNVESRREYRELILTTPGLRDCINGVILYDETIRQHATDGTPFVQLIADAGLLIGIKVDTGAKALAAFPAETVTEGLDGLRERLKDYAAMGARFAKWRGVIANGESGSAPSSRGCIEVNAQALARYAALCQEVGLVPIIEPEVLMDGSHTMARCRDVADAVLHSVFEQLHLQRVSLEAMILKSNMVLPRLGCVQQVSVDEVADATVRTLLRVVPAAVPGVAFLSGGQSGELASARLNAMHVLFRSSGPPGSTLPWALAFSFARAIQQPALDPWGGKAVNRAAAQQALLHRARCNCAALQGEYGATMEAP